MLETERIRVEGVDLAVEMVERFLMVDDINTWKLDIKKATVPPISPSEEAGVFRYY